MREYIIVKSKHPDSPNMYEIYNAETGKLAYWTYFDSVKDAKRFLHDTRWDGKYNVTVSEDLMDIDLKDALQ